jgi:hypothetical protein
MKIKIEISIGELIDKISILIIKKEKIKNPQKLIEIDRELKLLETHGSLLREKNKQKYDTFLKKLITINSKLWTIEDDIRILEKNSNFNEEFISLARDVYFTNDDRFSCKSDINQFYGSEIKEVKEYIDYKKL